MVEEHRNCVETTGSGVGPKSRMSNLFVDGSGLGATMQRGRGRAGGDEAEMLFWGRAC